MGKSKVKISSTIFIWIYLCVCLIGVVFLYQRYKSIISSHDSELTLDVNQLIVEKMNSSITSMQKSVREMAMALSYQDSLDFDQLYGQLTDSLPAADYIGVGIVSKDGKVYGLSSEQEEFVKWNLVELARDTEDISISEPYRSARSGKLVITMFSPVYQKGERLGCVFVTYPLSDIQEIADSDVLQDEVEIYLMNSKSGNIILCSGSDAYKIGNWNNTKLMKSQISKDTFSDYQAWESDMMKGKDAGTVLFDMDGVTYIQVYEKIISMKDWNVVVRIPDNLLSASMRKFSYSTMLFFVVMLGLSIGLIGLLRRRDVLEKERFEYLSSHDALTSVYNRAAFERKSREYLKDVNEKTRGALIFLDVDKFKQINDKYGHDCGDRALVAFSESLEKVFGDISTIARYGGDEFVILVKRVSRLDVVNVKLDLLKNELDKIQVTDPIDENFHLTYSAGVVAITNEEHDFEELVKHADLALYKVKQNGRNDYFWYEEGISYE